MAVSEWGRLCDPHEPCLAPTHTPPSPSPTWLSGCSPARWWRGQHILGPFCPPLSVRAKSRLCDTITQTWYYHVCVILRKHGDIQSITYPWVSWRRDTLYILNILNFKKKSWFLFKFGPVEIYKVSTLLDVILCITKYHTDVILSRLCDCITQTWFGPNCHVSCHWATFSSLKFTILNSNLRLPIAGHSQEHLIQIVDIFQDILHMYHLYIMLIFEIYKAYHRNIRGK